MSTFDPNSENAVKGLAAQGRVQKLLQEALLGQANVKETRKILEERGIPEKFINLWEQRTGDLTIEFLSPTSGRPVRTFTVEVDSTEKTTGSVSLGLNKLKNFEGDYHCFTTPEYTCFISRKAVSREGSRKVVPGLKEAYILLSPAEFQTDEVMWGIREFVGEICDQYLHPRLYDKSEG